MVLDGSVMRRSGRLQLGLGAAALGAALGCVAVSRADPAGSSPPTEQQKAEKETELRGVEDTIRASEDQRRAIESQLESMRADRARLSAALIETTAKVQDAERGEAAADDRLAALNGKADALARSLDSQRDTMAEVLAALQRMGANPPPAILIKPRDMAEAVRAASGSRGSIFVKSRNRARAGLKTGGRRKRRRFLLRYRPDRC